MKGIAHFVTGVALATFFPDVVQQAAAGSLLPVLGGIAGILPDTLDFKFARYFERYSCEIDPGPDPDAHQIADELATAMRVAYESHIPQDVCLHTIRLAADLWRQYVVRFDPQRNEISVKIGPVVNTGQVPLPGSEPEQSDEVRIRIGVPMVHTYDAENRVDIFGGPSFRFIRKEDRLHVHFLDWHRRWSHSLTLALVLGLLAAGITALVQLVGAGSFTSLPCWAGLLVWLGFAGHVLEDQLGHMGSNLFFPFTRERTGGLRLLRSGDAIPNFLTFWLSVAIIIFNLDRFGSAPCLDPPVYLLLAIILPMVVLGGLYQLQRRRGVTEAQEFLRQKDIVSDAEEVDMG